MEFDDVVLPKIWYWRRSGLSAALDEMAAKSSSGRVDDCEANTLPQLAYPPLVEATMSLSRPHHFPLPILNGNQ